VCEIHASAIRTELLQCWWLQRQGDVIDGERECCALRAGARWFADGDAYGPSTLMGVRKRQPALALRPAAIGGTQELPARRR